MIYNANNQLTQWGSATISYDLDGNTLNDGTNAYVWDARNRLVSANSGGAAYAYDPLAPHPEDASVLVNRVPLRWREPGTRTEWYYSHGQPADGRRGRRFQRTDSTGTYSYLTDALGSTMALTDSTGAQQATYSYGPYGSMSITGSTTNSYGYTGRESDGLGIDYYRARYYNPQTGRFISEDPMGFRAAPTSTPMPETIQSILSTLLEWIEGRMGAAGTMGRRAMTHGCPMKTSCRGINNRLQVPLLQTQTPNPAGGPSVMADWRAI